METFAQIIGWIGTLLIILAYFAVSNKKLSPQSKTYQFINLFGAIGVGINAFYSQAWPSTGLQVIWGIIAIIALIKSLNQSKMKGILFVCQGNMMRSQIAEALYKKYKNKNAFSAGIFPIIENHDGKKLKEIEGPELFNAMKDKEKIDLSNNICKEVAEEMVQKAEKVVVMANREIWPNFLKDRKDLIYWKVENPEVADYKKFSEIIDKIKEKIITL